MEILDAILKYIVAPITAFIWILHQRQQDQRTDIAVLKADAISARASHDREMNEFRNVVSAIFKKLDSIETTLRK
jgi:hypothetical protein